MSMLSMRQTLRRRLPAQQLHATRTHLGTTSAFSVSTHQCIRRRRPTRGAGAAAVVRNPAGPRPEDASPVEPVETKVQRVPEKVVSPPGSTTTTTTTTTTTSAHSPHHDPISPSTPDTSAAGPYRHVLLSSRVIRYCPERTSSRGPASSTARSHLTTRTTQLQARQVSAAEKFFSHRHEFLYSAESLRHHPTNTHVPEIIILGASNVGKSTFLNALVGSSSAARVSQRPGRTTLMNAFGVGPLPKIPRASVPKGTAPPKHSLVLVDTPGYGYRSQASWGDAVVKYLQSRRMLRGAVVLLSSEKKLLPEDRWMLRTLAEANTRTVVVLTKADKGRAGWTDKCVSMADAIQSELDVLDQEFGGRWRHSDGAASSIIYVTSAGMDTSGKLRNGAGMGGVRTAILEMAGFTLQDTVAKKAETVTYSGPIVSFDDIQWKT